MTCRPGAFATATVTCFRILLLHLLSLSKQSKTDWNISKCIFGTASLLVGCALSVIFLTCTSLLLRPKPNGLSFEQSRF
ncbi:uncharacterized protein EV420DRAFT_1533136 [Desarmillaria tabescens]|uniref:Uncharacterized protein n=1 Tax=Armillaria tabescens TaxID=1929756 RepID=A0AA39N7S7_ARMTA|nr:uncharacterized protein EV420DRAFT_1533136 [Desarmillaria tabescens]KAK0460607.1 hypothetical protein EV420DRAFT_1533136 [Desarmillaria tabescens]